MTAANYVYFSDVLSRCELDAFVWCVSKNKERTYGDLAVAANGWKLAFQKARVNRVAIYFTEIFDSAAALLGAMAAGVVAVLPADTTKTTCERLCQGVVEACAGDFTGDCAMTIIEPEETNEPCRDRFDEKAKLIELFTSGSTGQPSLIVKRLSQLFVEVDSIEKRQSCAGIDDRALIVSTVSQQHIYGLLFYLLWPLASGRRVWHTRITAPEEIIHLASQEKASAWVSSPAHLKRLPDSPDWQKIRGKMQAVYSSGGPLSEEGLRRTVALTGLSPQEFLGSSESGGIAIRQRQIAQDGTLVKLEWQALPSVQWKCEDGLLVIKSPQLATDGWEVTPDRIEPLPGGNSFMHLGRADRIVKIEEKRVSMTAVENALLDSGLVQAAKTLQLDDSRRTFAAVAVPSQKAIEILKTSGKAALVKVLKTHLVQSFEVVCLPRRWRFVSGLPENSMGKTSILSLMALFQPESIQFVVESRSTDSANLIVTIPTQCPYFDGHFPEFALLPGVAQIEMSIQLGRTLFSMPETFAGLKNLKFMKPVRPNDTVFVQLKWDVVTSQLEFAWFNRDREPYARGKAEFVERDAT